MNKKQETTTKTAEKNSTVQDKKQDRQTKQYLFKVMEKLDQDNVSYVLGYN